MKRSDIQCLWVSTVMLTLLTPALLNLADASSASDAPNAPGAPSVWAPAAKECLGTSVSNASRVYFTGAEGGLTEVFYPTLDKVHNVDLQFLVTNAAKSWGGEERKQQTHTVKLINPRSMVWQVVTTDHDGRWKITKKIFADPNRNTVIQRVTF